MLPVAFLSLYTHTQYILVIWFANRYKSLDQMNITSHYTIMFTKNPGGRLNKKDGLTRYGNSHVKDKTS